jgi:hypothetical protein
MKLSYAILLLTSISTIASPLHASQVFSHTPPSEERDTLSTTETKLEFSSKLTPTTASSVTMMITNGVHSKRNQSEGDPQELGLYTFVGYEDNTTPPNHDTTSAYATFNVPDINYHLSSSTQDGSYS